MRHWFLVLLIALLPLRGWLGDAMALQDIATAPETTVVTANKGHRTAVEASFSHENEVAGLAGLLHAGCHEAGAEGDPDSAATGHMAHCSACGICHSTALSPDLPLSAPTGLPTAAPLFRTVAVTSATPAPSLKPPIS